MSDFIQTAGVADHVAETAAPSILVNTTTKEELLSRAKDAVDAGEQSIHEAAEALATAEELHRASQREMAEAIGKSASWVNKLLKWRRSGYKNHSPFGPTTKRGRVEHAQQHAEACRKRNAPAANNASPGPKRRPAETLIDTSSANDVTLLAQFKYAVDHWLPPTSDQAKREAVSYVLEKAGVRVS